jgi:hypothetical protein
VVDLPVADQPAADHLVVDQVARPVVDPQPVGLVEHQLTTQVEGLTATQAEETTIRCPPITPQRQPIP